MLEIKIPETEFYDESNSKFIKTPEATLHLEHSLLSVSKWETFWGVPFLTETKKTTEQLLSYIGMMSEVPVDPEVLQRLGSEQYAELNAYLNGKHSATWFSDSGEKSVSRQTVTSELIYYWMTAFNIPFECERWPLSRLMNLIKIAQIKNDPKAKQKGRPKSQMLSERAALNAKRRAESNSKG